MRKRHIFLLTIFKDMTEEQQNLLLPLVTLCRFSKGHTIFNQGDKADHLYIVESGLVDILFKPGDGPVLTISHLTSGGVFGWSSTLGRDGYTSSACAIKESEVYCFDSRELRQLCEDHPDTGMVILDRLALAISERLEATHGQIMSVLKEGMDLNYDL